MYLCVRKNKQFVSPPPPKQPEFTPDTFKHKIVKKLLALLKTDAYNSLYYDSCIQYYFTVYFKLKK